MTTATTRSAKPRVWLAGTDTVPAGVEPADRPVVRDHLMHQWNPGTDGRWHTPDECHHATWAELHARFDLVEVIGR